MFEANANLPHLESEYEKVILKEKIQEIFQDLLNILEIDPNDPNVVDTPKRIAKMYVDEIFQGKFNTMPKMTTFPNTKNLDELFVVGPITFRSCCSHHFVPFMGKAWIGVIPDKLLLGLSKFARLTEWVMARPQIQEEAIMMLADLLEEIIQPKGLCIVMKAQHFCMCWRGIKDADAQMTNCVVRGMLKEAEARAEFFELIKVQK